MVANTWLPFQGRGGLFIVVLESGDRRKGCGEGVNISLIESWP